MQVFTPSEVSRHTANKYLGVLVAAKFARILNEFPGGSAAREKKLTTRALEELTDGDIDYRVVPRRRS
jgi:DNA-directed RNA polymerase subunit K/omega